MNTLEDSRPTTFPPAHPFPGVKHTRSNPAHTFALTRQRTPTEHAFSASTHFLSPSSCVSLCAPPFAGAKESMLFAARAVHFVSCETIFVLDILNRRRFRQEYCTMRFAACAFDVHSACMPSMLSTAWCRPAHAVFDTFLHAAAC